MLKAFTLLLKQGNSVYSGLSYKTKTTLQSYCILALLAFEDIRCYRSLFYAFWVFSSKPSLYLLGTGSSPSAVTIENVHT